MYNVITEIIGFIALAVADFGYWQKTKLKIIRFRILSLIIFIIHYILKEALCGAILTVFDLLRDYIFSKIKTKKGENIAFYTIIPFYVLLGIFICTNIFEVVIISASIVNVYTLTKRKNDIVISGIIECGCWLIYDIYIHSFSGITSDLITITNNILVYNQKGLKKRLLRKI